MISCNFGLPGTGKTMALVRSGYEALCNGVNVYSNVTINWRGLPPRRLGVFSREARPIDLFHKFQSLENIFDKKNCLILLDEGWLYLNSYFRSQATIDVQSKIFQSRKDGIDIIYTTQRIGQISAQLRDLTNFFYLCESQQVGLRYWSTRIFYMYPCDVTGSDYRISQRYVIRKVDGEYRTVMDIVAPTRYVLTRKISSLYDSQLKVEDDVPMADIPKLFPFAVTNGHIVRLSGIPLPPPRDDALVLPPLHRETRMPRHVYPPIDGILPPIVGA